MNASAILREAASIVAGARNKNGEPDRAFDAIARDWTTYLTNRREPFAPIRAVDVCRMMARLKQIRAEWCETYAADHAVDEAGYAAIGGEIMAGGAPEYPQRNFGMNGSGWDVLSD